MANVSTVPVERGGWDAFKAFVSDAIRNQWPLLYRGHADSTWKLTSSWHRLQQETPLSTYWDLLHELEDQVGTWTGRRWDLTKDTETAAFVAYLQHHGFPTPLLDWTLSPYIAAYFAFAAMDDFAPTSDDVSVFVFAHSVYQAEWEQRYDFSTDVEHVSVLRSASLGNQRQLLHQGSYTYSTVLDQGDFLVRRGVEYTEKHSEVRSYVMKYDIPAAEKPRAMRDLRLMGISAMSLFPGAEGVCRYLKDSYLASQKIGMTPTEKRNALTALLRDHAARSSVQPNLGLGSTPPPREDTDYLPVTEPYPDAATSRPSLWDYPRD
ncbi:MAG: FRG domain-containing protein [Gemmatimonadota bacterium]